MSLYLRDALPEAKAEELESHYFECDACWDLVQTATELRALGARERSARPRAPARLAPRSFFANPGLKIAATILVVLGASVFLLWWSDVRTTGTQGLARAAGGAVPFPVRLTGDFAALGPPAVLRGPRVTPSATLRLQADRLIELDERRPSARTAHDAGIARLMLGDANGAVESLRRAEPTPSVLADLSAAYLARAIETRSQEDVRLALDTAKRSLQTASSREALFNYADALDRLEGADRPSRRAAWKAYLDADPRSGWSDLARHRLEEVGAEPTPVPSPEVRKTELRSRALGEGSDLDRSVAADPQLAREYLEEELLVDALRSPRRDIVLEETAARLAGSLLRVTGNALPEETIAHARSVSQEWMSPRRASLAEAHESYARGLSLYRRREIGAASAAFETTERELRRLESPFAVQAGIGRVGCLINANRLSEAYDAASALRSQEEAQGTAAAHPYVVARLEWAMGLVRHRQGYASEAIAAFDRAAAVFTRLGERENSAAVDMLLAQAHDAAGDFRAGWGARERAMTSLELLTGSDWRARILGDAAAASSADGQHHLARYLLDLQVDAAPSSNEPLLVDALISRAVEGERIGELGRSREDLERASRVLQRISEPAIRDRSAAQLALLRARLDLSRSVEARLADLDAAIRFFEPAGNHLWLADGLEERGRLELARADSERAESDWRRGVRELEELRGRAGTEDLRISKFATGRRLFDDLIGLLMSRGRSQEAFELAEEARARALLDRVSVAEEPGTEAPPRADLRGSIGKGTTLVSYFALPDRLCVWAVSRERIVAREVPVTREAVRRLAEIHRREVRGESDRGEEASESLYRATIEPVATALDEARLVVFVPDDVLHAVSFAALRPAHGLRVVQRWPTEVAPSVRYFVAVQGSPANERGPGHAPPSLVLAGTYAAAPLESLRREVAEVSSELGGPLVLEGPDLTKDRFLALAPGRDVIHFAGHGLGEESDGPSALLLGPHDSLFPGEIQALDLRGVRLVYLSACSTARGTLRPGEGPTSVARAFLASGAREVVATLWPIDDSSAAAIAVRFYRFVRSGDTPAGALRRAQLELLAGSGNPARGSMSWAAFQLHGAGSAPKGG